MVLSRNIHKYKLPPGIEQIANERVKLGVTVSYLINSLNILIPSDEPQVKELGEFKLFYKFFETIQLAPKIKLRSMDTLHLVYAMQLAKKGAVKYFITLDSEILGKKKDIQTATGLKVLGED